MLLQRKKEKQEILNYEIQLGHFNSFFFIQLHCL